MKKIITLHCGDIIPVDSVEYCINTDTGIGNRFATAVNYKIIAASRVNA